MTTKKLFIIALIFFILASSSLVVYNFVLPLGGSDNEVGNGKPLNLEIKQIGNKKAFSLTIAEDGQSIKYYLKDNGRVVKSAFDGSSPAVISDVSLPELYKAVWSPDKTKVLSYFKKPEGIIRYSFDYKTQKSAALNENIKGIAWSPSGEKIAYQFIKEEEQQNSISIADADTSNWKNVLPTRLNNLIVLWPVPDKIYLYNAPSGIAKGSLYSLDYASGDFKKIISDQFGFAAKISPDGQRILYQATDERGKNLKLFISSQDGSGQKELKVSTVTEKCAWSLDSQNVFCAVPREISKFAVWPDDYFAGRLAVSDDFYLIDAQTGKKTKIAGSLDQQSFDAAELTLSPKEDYLFFINRLTGFVYNIKLAL